MNGPRSTRSAGAVVRSRRRRFSLLATAALAFCASWAPAAAAPPALPLGPGLPSAPPPPRACADAALPVAALSAARVRAALRCLLAHERARIGAGPLRPLRKLTRAAKAHTAAMVAGAWFGHVSPQRETFRERLRRNRLAPRYAGEALAWGCGEQTTPAHAVAGWLASPPHRALILSRRYTHSGVGFRRVAAHYAQCAPGVTWTLLVARF